MSTPHCRFLAYLVRPPLLTLEEGQDVLAVLDAAAAPGTAVADHVAALADRLRVRLYAATHDA